MRKEYRRKALGVLYALLPRWVERRGICGPCDLLRGRRVRAFADGTRVEERLERLCDPAKCGVVSVIEYGKFLDNSELVNGRLSWSWCFRFHLRA